MWGWIRNQACLGPPNGSLYMERVCLVVAAIAWGSPLLVYADWAKFLNCTNIQCDTSHCMESGK